MKLRICLIGAGRAGSAHLGNAVRRTHMLELVSVCDADGQVARRVSEKYGVAKHYTDYHEAIADPEVEAVVVVTPCFLHKEIACAAAEAGKHMFVEKPMAMSVEECTAVNDAVERAGVKLQIGFMRRFDVRFQRAKALIAGGGMGRVMIVKSTSRGPGLPPPWIYDLKKSNGILAEVNSHDFDSVRWLADSEIVRVYADGANMKCDDARESFPDFFDNAVVHLRFANGALGTIDGTCPCHYGYDARMEILCERGVIFVGNAAQHGTMRVVVDDPAVTGVGTACQDAVKSWRDLFKDAYLAELEHFAACIQDDRIPDVTGYDGLKAVEAVCAANRSLAEGWPIDLPGNRAS